MLDIHSVNVITLGIRYNVTVNNKVVCTCDSVLKKIAKLGIGIDCNIVNYPTVDANDAFASAFAVMADTENVSRMVEIIYAISAKATIITTTQSPKNIFLFKIAFCLLFIKSPIHQA